MQLQYIRPYLLGDEAFAFVRRELQWAGDPYYTGLGLCYHLQDLPLERGRIVTYLPPDVELVRIQFFDAYFGSVFPPPDTYYEQYSPEQRVVLSRLVETHLQIGATHYAIGLENVGKGVLTDSLAREKHPVFTYDGEIYYFRHQKDRYRNSLVKSLRHFVYPGMSVLTSTHQPIRNRAEVPASLIIELATRTRYIILDVYDGTGYLYWCQPGAPYPHEIVGARGGGQHDTEAR